MNIDDLKGCFANITDDELLRDNGNLYAENKELKQEIERLNNKNEELLTLYTSEREVKDYYKNIINELEKYIDEDDWTSVNGEIAIRLIKLKLQQLKGSDKE